MSLFFVEIDETHVEELTKYLESFNSNEIDFVNTGEKSDIQMDLVKFLSRKISKEFGIDDEAVLEEFANTFDSIADDIEDELDSDDFYMNFERYCLDEDGNLSDYSIEFSEILDLNSIDLTKDSDEIFMSELRDLVKIIELNFDENAVASAIIITKEGLDNIYQYKGFFYENAIIVEDFNESTIRNVVDEIFKEIKLENIFDFQFFDDDDFDDDFDDFDDFLLN